MSTQEAFVFRYESNAEAMKESMVLAGKFLQAGPARTSAMALLSIAAFLFVVFGGIAFARLLNILFEFVPQSFFWLDVLGASVGVWLAFGWYERLVKLMAQGVLDAPFNDGPQEMRFDASGVSLIKVYARWHTDWSGIHKVQMGKLGLNVFLSGIALYVPKAELPEDIEAMIAQLDTWRSAQWPNR